MLRCARPVGHACSREVSRLALSIERPLNARWLSSGTRPPLTCVFCSFLQTVTPIPYDILREGVKY